MMDEQQAWSKSFHLYLRGPLTAHCLKSASFAKSTDLMIVGAKLNLEYQKLLVVCGP